MSQKQLAQLTGISLSTIQRLEAGEDANPKLRHLNNCALALGCSLADLIEPAWMEWLVVSEKGPHAAPDEADLAAARDASFGKSPGRPITPGSRRWHQLPRKRR